MTPVAKEEVFELKGGTAINLFERNLPRLSVDIDLTYLPFDEREAALAGVVSKCLDRAFTGADTILASVMVKAKFWEKHDINALNPRQRMLLTRLLDEFEGKLTSFKWVMQLTIA
jgi:hypothetical protein